jgi:activator of HSP90 ATPase
MLPASPQEVYRAWLSSKEHGTWTEGEAKISSKVGGTFFTFDGYSSGKNIELDPGKLIVQTWRAEDWAPDHFSTIKLQLLAAPKGTKVIFTQTDVPADKAKSIAQGWKDYYWQPMKLYFSQKV